MSVDVGNVKNGHMKSCKCSELNGVINIYNDLKKEMKEKT